MKKTIIYLFLVASFISCNKSDESTTNEDIIGTWKLIETLADPGDGSGTFRSVDSDKILEFHENGIVTSNGALCSMSIESDEITTGTYSLVDSTITPVNCDNQWSFEFTLEGNTLVLYFPCIEPCAAKYKKQ